MVSEPTIFGTAPALIIKRLRLQILKRAVSVSTELKKGSYSKDFYKTASAPAPAECYDKL